MSQVSSSTVAEGMILKAPRDEDRIQTQCVHDMKDPDSECIMKVLVETKSFFYLYVEPC